MRPILNTHDKPMFQGIDVNVIHVTLEILFVSDRSLPKSSLPQCKLAVTVANERHTGSDQLATEAALDATPATGIIGVVQRQCEDRMQMLR